MTATKTVIHNWHQDTKSIWKFGGLTFRELVRGVLRDAQENEVFKRASGLAFDFLLALFPFLFILIAVFGLFTSHSFQLRTSLLVYFADLLPAPAFQLLNNTTEELAANVSGERLMIGLIIGLWLISGGVASIIASLNVAFRIKESRSWFKVRAIALGLALVISVLILTALCIVIVGEDVVDWVGSELRLTSAMVGLWKALQWPAAMLFVMFSDALIYIFGPNLRNKRWHLITPGSVFGATSWVVASAGFRIYLRYVNNYNVIFGSLGALVILMIWLYVTGLAFLIGGEINANIERAAAENLND
jgi:membrane protein